MIDLIEGVLREFAERVRLEAFYGIRDHGYHVAFEDPVKKREYNAYWRSTHPKAVKAHNDTYETRHRKERNRKQRERLKALRDKEKARRALTSV